MDHLAARGVPCPTPIHGRDGEALRALCGRPAALVSFLDGISPRRVAGRAIARRSAGRWRGCIWPAPISAWSRPNALSVASWRSLFEACRAGADGVPAGLEAEVARELDDLERALAAGSAARA